MESGIYHKYVLITYLDNLSYVRALCRACRPPYDHATVRNDARARVLTPSSPKYKCTEVGESAGGSHRAAHHHITLPPKVDQSRYRGRSRERERE